jgi:hypothetical protein
VRDLPENDIPDSLWRTLHHSLDFENADNNRTGYVEDALAMTSASIDSSPHSTVIPMMSSGVVDVNCSELSTVDIRTNLSSRYRSDGVHRVDDKESTSCAFC